MTTKTGAELTVGDMIEVWGANSVYRITALEPYTGSLARIFPAGAQIATIVGAHLTGITIDNDHIYAVA